jgi:hypothetical protein
MAVSRDNNNVKLASATMRLYEVRKEISSRGMPQFNKSAVVGSHRDELMKVAALLRQEAIEKQDLLEKLAVGGRLGAVLSAGKKLLPMAAKAFKPAGPLASTMAAKTLKLPSAVPRAGKRLGESLKSVPKEILKLPYTVPRDVIKGTGQVLSSAARTIRNPSQTFKNYRSPGAAVQQSIKDYPASPISQAGSAARNLLRDTAGVPANSKTSIVGDLGRTLWNPSIPTAGRTASSLGTGAKIGGPILAANAYVAGKGAVTKADEFIANQPITGNEKIDSYLDPASRQAYNRKLYYETFPKTLWSGITGKNPVDKQLVNDVASRIWNSVSNSRHTIGEKSTEDIPYSLKNLLTKQIGGRIADLGDKVKKQPLVQTLRALHESGDLTIENLQNSEVYKGLVASVNSLKPSDKLSKEQLEAYKQWLLDYVKELPSKATEATSQVSRHLPDQVSRWTTGKNPVDPAVRRSLEN